MKSGVTFRLAAFGLAVGVMGVLMVLLTLSSQREADELRERLATIDSESFNISEQFKDRLREANTLRLREAIDHNPTNWTQFLKSSSELDEWIDQQGPQLTTQKERDALQVTKTYYDDFIQTVIRSHGGPGPQTKEGEALAEFNLRTKSQRVFDNGQMLAKAHYDSRNALLARANQTLTKLRRQLLGLLASLFVFGVALAALAYRDLIVPLKVKLVESQMLVEQKEKLASLGLLAAGVAHEIRNPLTAIKAAVFMQQKKLAPGSQERADSDLVQREILRLERIVTDFLQFARPAEPQLNVISANFPLEEVQKLLAPAMAKSNIQLMVEPSPSSMINVDGEQIKQILINLVQNAADSIGQDGAIILRSKVDKKVLDNRERDVVILEVTDNGKGIPPDVQKRLFDPFFTTKNTGTGLGLSIAACLVENHGGALQYQTQSNRGTTFGIVLPVDRA